jgi:hypothetical protein
MLNRIFIKKFKKMFQLLQQHETIKVKKSELQIWSLQTFSFPHNSSC